MFIRGWHRGALLMLRRQTMLTSRWLKIDLVVFCWWFNYLINSRHWFGFRIFTSWKVYIFLLLILSDFWVFTLFFLCCIIGLFVERKCFFIHFNLFYSKHSLLFLLFCLFFSMNSSTIFLFITRIGSPKCLLKLVILSSLLL